MIYLNRSQRRILVFIINIGSFKTLFLALSNGVFIFLILLILTDLFEIVKWKTIKAARRIRNAFNENADRF